MNITSWTHGDSIFLSEQIEDHVAFVYLITNLVTNKKYVGKKLFTASKTFQKNLKKKRKRVESEWKSYYGSSEELKADVAKYGKDNFKREILRLCKSKSEANYYELKEQIIRDVLLRSDYYNSFAGTRIHKKHLKNLFIS